VTPTHPYDAVLLLSFGGPEGPQDVMPFLEKVTGGRGIPRERLLSVAEHYLAFGGRSPINDQNRALLAALRTELDRRGSDVPLLWGNRNWAPLLTPVLREAHEAGARRILVLLTSAYSSYSGCRQYREDLARALLELRAEGRELRVDKVRAYFNHPGFLAPQVDSVVEALAALRARSPRGPRGQGGDEDVRVLFVTHSLPIAMDAAAGPAGHAYVLQHLDVCATVMTGVGQRLGRTPPQWELLYCSRSGRPGQPWLEPDVDDRLAQLSANGVDGVVAVPVGFVSDHMEVVYDLDTQAAATARHLGLPLRRAATVGTDRRFVAGLVDLVMERAAISRGEAVERAVGGGLGPSPDVCPVGCCPNPLADEPAACGEDWPAEPAATPAPEPREPVDR